jgi:hypothetical protein
MNPFKSNILKFHIGLFFPLIAQISADLYF